MSKSYLLKIRGGVEVDSQGKKAGKGPLISEEVSATLGVSQDQYLFQPVICVEQQAGRGIFYHTEDQAPTLCSDSHMHAVIYALEGGGRGHVINLNKDDVQSKQILDPKGIAPSIYAGESRGGGGELYVLENHPADSRVKIDESGKVQTLTSRMGTGGGNIPMILEPKVYGISAYESNAMKSSNPHSGIYEAKTSRTLDLNGGNPACNQGGMIVLEGNGARPSHKGGGRVMSLEVFHCTTEEDKTQPLKARDYKDPLVLAIDRAAFNQGENAKYDFQISGGVQRKRLLPKAQEQFATRNNRKLMCKRFKRSRKPICPGRKSDNGKT